MSQTQVITQTQTKLDLTELKTVKWLRSNYYLRRSYDVSADQYKRLKIVTLFSWLLMPIEMVLISILLFVHKLPWPDWALQILFKVDRMIENILEFIARKFEWWFDVLTVRLMWFLDSAEAFIDSMLSLTIFVAQKILNLWMWSISVVVKFIHMMLYPYIWVFHQIMPQDKIPKPSATPEITLTRILDVPEARDSGISSDKDVQRKEDNDKEKIIDEGDHISNTSEYDSDVSALSESWKIGHTNIAGKYYNRVEMKATAEGRLRAAMYKRVKTQLQLMRKNSVNFSRGMTFYAQAIVEPKIRQIMDSIYCYLLQLAKKHNLLIYYEKLVKWMDSNPVLAIPFNIAFATIGIPYKFLLLVFGRKRKSKRTRSMRSESLRRKTVNLVGNVSAEPIGLGKSAEPVLEDAFCNDPKSILKEGSDSETGTRDSALASSIDDSYHTSDSGDGSHSIKEQTIEEEKEDEINEGTKREATKISDESTEIDKTEPLTSGIEKTNSEGLSNNTESPRVNKSSKIQDFAKSNERRRKKRTTKMVSLSHYEAKSTLPSETCHSKPLSPILTNSNSDLSENSQSLDSPEVSPKGKRKISFTL